MPKSNGTILVAPIPGEELRYWVESWTDPAHPYLVDLSYFGGSGRCSCTDFDTRRGPAIKAGAQLFSRATSCKHLIAARTYWMQEELAKRAQALGGQNENQT